MYRPTSAASLRLLALAGSLGVAAVTAVVAPLVAQAADPNAACGASVFVNAHTWTPHLTADDAGSKSVSGSGYSIDFQWTIDWDSLTGTVDAQVTSGDYSLIGANVWYTVPAPEFEGDPTEGSLPKVSSFAHTVSSSSSYVFNNPQLTSLYSIQLVIAQCSEPVTTDPVTTDPVTTDPATTDPATTDPATPTTAVSGSGSGTGSGGTLPATGASPSAAILALAAGAAGTVLWRVARRRPGLG